MRYRCHLADTHRALDHQRAFYADAIHPNNAGAEAMAQAIVEPLSGPPLSRENARIRFDQGEEVRFLNYVFLPERQGKDPQWISISELSPRGMVLDTPIPMRIRTAPVYEKGEYRVELIGKRGAALETIETKAEWNAMLIVRVTPKADEMPMHIRISRGGWPRGRPRKVGVGCVM